ncbi:MAG TPA: outer membrane beta-barrel protein [Hyphomicrobiaceae bacterium]|nr:outer membrane beta-barrel protein [Hyphomicrobiaceae bacterium]
MRTMRLLVLGAAIYASGSLLARADGTASRPYYTPYACATCDAVYLGYDWSGFYAGVHAGVLFAASEWDLLAPGTDQHTATGFAGGVQIGYQKQWGNMVAGVEISYTATDADVSSHTTFLAATAAQSTEVSNLLLVTGRLGYANDNLLAYLKAGYASADVDFSFSIAAPPTSGSSGEREHGWTAGVGLEYAIRDNIILGLEYNYVRLNADERVLAPSTVASSSADIDMQTILARVSFRFGARSEAAMK